jgi:hypothetical protein
MTCVGSHHKMYRKTVEGAGLIITRVSHGKGDVGDHAAIKMAKQCRLRLHEFWDLVDCPLSEADWDAKVRERYNDPAWSLN